MIITKILNKVLNIRAKKMFKRNAVIGNNFKIGAHSRCTNEMTADEIKIGDNVSIYGQLIVTKGGKINIGNYVTVRYHTTLTSSCEISIGSYVMISSNVMIRDNNSHPISPEFRKQMSIDGPETEKWKAEYADNSPIIIEDNVWVGERAVILKGVRIGKGSIVACDAVVTKDVPEYSIVAGNPARIVKKIEV